MQHSEISDQIPGHSSTQFNDLKDFRGFSHGQFGPGLALKEVKHHEGDGGVRPLTP